MMAFLAAQDVSEAVTNEWRNAEQQTSVAREQLDAVYSQSISVFKVTDFVVATQGIVEVPII